MSGAPYTRGAASFDIPLVATPTEQDVRKYADQGLQVCGNCRHFDIDQVAQDKIHGERFYERLVREEGWKVKHLCSRPDDLGLCGLSNGEMMTGRLHKGCDQYTPSNGRVRLRLKTEKL